MNNIYKIVTVFILLHPWITIYLAGSVIAFGIVYSLVSGNYLNPPSRKRIFIVAIISSWITVIAFLYGFLKGFLETIFKGSENDDD